MSAQFCQRPLGFCQFCQDPTRGLSRVLLLPSEIHTQGNTPTRGTDKTARTHRSIRAMLAVQTQAVTTSVLTITATSLTSVKIWYICTLPA
jgi:hypothetical protein